MHQSKSAGFQVSKRGFILKLYIGTHLKKKAFRTIKKGLKKIDCIMYYQILKLTVPIEIFTFRSAQWVTGGPNA